MKTNFLISLPILGSLALASCYPIQEGPNNRGPRQNAADETVSSQDQQKIKEQRDRMKEREERKRLDAANNTPDRKENSDTTSPKPKEQKSKDYAFANPVPGKEGFVFSPYNQKLVDVRDIPSGTLVQDPTYPASEKKYFRVP